MTDWNAIRQEYAGGGISLRELARKYGVSGSTLQHRAARENWKEMRSENMEKAAKPAELQSSSAARSSQLLHAAEKTVRMISEQLDRMAACGEVKISELKAAADVLKTARELYRTDGGGADDHLQKARELLGGVPDALDG